MSRKRVLIAAGGTGGHLIPAQALAEQLGEVWPPIETHFAAFGLGTSRYFDRDRFEYTDIRSSTLSLRHPFRSLRGGVRLVRGALQARRLVQRWQPDVVVGFGSYHALPVLFTAGSVPVILHESNAYPGRVVRLFSKKSFVTGVAIPEARRYLKGNVVPVPMPLRSSYAPAHWSIEEARTHFGLDPALPTLLVFGGSQGAVALNRTVALALQKNSSWQVIHLTGHHDDPRELAPFYRDRLPPFYLARYERQMARAWAAADLVIMRAGASSVAELVAMKCPGILVPYPYATNAHQDANAQWIQALGGGIYLPQKDLSVDRLMACLEDCTPERLAAMQQALYAYQTKPARTLLDCVMDVLS